MARLAPLIINNLPETLESVEPEPLAQLEALWHFECVVSPRSPPALKQTHLHSSPNSSPRSTAASPRSPVIISPRSSAPISPRSAPAAYPSISPPSPAAASSCSRSSSRSSSLSRFASATSSTALQRVFSTFDENGDGRVSIDEISNIFERLGMPNSEYSIQSLLARLVTKSQGHVDEEEFLQLYDTVCSFVEELDASASSSSLDTDVDQDLLAAFHVFDKDGNGFISPAELQAVLCSLGFPQARQLDACVDMIARVDEDGDGHVDFFEFKKLFHLDNPFNMIQSF